MRIVIVSHETFREGAAQENRQLCLAKGLSAAGHEAEILTLSSLSAAAEFLKDGVLVRGFSPVSLPRAPGLGLKYLRFCYHLVRSAAQRRIDCIVMQSLSNTAIVLVYLLTRALGIKYIRDQAEYPDVHKPGYGRLRLFLYTRFIFGLFDGLALVSDALISFFQDALGKDLRILKLPMVVEPDRFREPGPGPGGRYIAYCGDMSNNKDGVSILIDAFRMIAGNYPDLRLYLIGKTSGVPECLGFMRQVENYKLRDRVIFTGKVSREAIPAYLCNATLLALARPANKQAEGGFPTKLGEYLAAGKPVVVTATGEIADYLVDGVSAFLAAPGDPAAFAAQLGRALADYGAALKVGAKGKELASGEFNCRVQASRLADFADALRR